MRAGDSMANFNLLHRAKGKIIIGKALRYHWLEERSRLWPHDHQNRFRHSNINGNGMRIIGNMAINPMKITSDCRCRSHNQKFFGAKTCYGHISFDMAIIIQELRIDDFANRNGNIICRNDLQHRLGIAANQFDLAKAGHVKHPHLLPNCHMFSRAVVKPILPAPAIFIFGLFAFCLFGFR